MTLHENLERLAFIDECAWMSFKKIKIAKGPNPYYFWQVGRVIAASDNLHWKRFWNIYLFWLVLAHICFVAALLQIFPDYTWMLAVAAFFAAARFFATWNKYSREYFRYHVGKADALAFAFGTDNAALFIKTFHEDFTRRIIDGQGEQYLERIKVKDFDALVKLNKAAQDKDEVNLGIGDTVKKATYGAFLLALVKVDFKGFKETFDVYSKFVSNFNAVQFRLLDWVLWSAVLLGICYTIYDLFIGQTSTKRKKKTYLLLLNIMKETWVETPEKNVPAQARDENSFEPEIWKVAGQELARASGLKKIAAYALLAWVLPKRGR